MCIGHTYSVLFIYIQKYINIKETKDTTMYSYILPIVLACLINNSVAAILRTPENQLLQSTDVSTRNAALENLLRDALESARELMIQGSDDVPVLDPFQLDEINIDENIIGQPNSHVTLRNITVVNGSTFVADQLSVTTTILLMRFRVNMDMRIPVLDVNTDDYDMSVTVFGGNIFGKGDMKVRIVNPRLHGTILIGISLTGRLTVIECRLHFGLQAFEPEITGMFDNQVTSNFVSDFLRILIPNLVNYYEADISDVLSSTVQEIMNDILRDLDLGSLLPFPLQDANEMST